MRYEIVDAVIPTILGEQRVGSPEFAHSMGIVRRTAEAIQNADGRPLYALPTYTAMLELRDLLTRRGDAESWR